MALFASINCFNAGELSPKMEGRPDVSQYSKGCRTLQNFIVTPYGAVERRPGLKFCGLAKSSAGAVKLVPFIYSSTIAYVCEFGDKYIRFWRDGKPVAKDGAVVEAASPYSGEELAEIKYVQSADVMTIVHPSHEVYELKRIAEDDFTLARKEYKYPPMLDPNLDDDATLTPSGVTGEITLTASKDTFDEGDVGGYYQLIHVRQENEISIDFKADGVSKVLEVFGFWTFTTHGTWSGALTIQRSFDGGASWKDYRTYSSAKDTNTSTSGEEEDEGVLYRLKMEEYEGSTSGTLRLCRCLLVNPDFTTTGVVEITAVTDAKTAEGEVLRKLGGTEATAEWNEGAWSPRRGYPRTIAFYEERMFFGGTAYRPQTVWGSKTNAWDDFLLGDKADDGLDFTLASDTVNTICWLCQHDALVIGTMDSEWTLSSSSSDSALTPSNFRVRRQSVYGASGTSAQMVGDAILFVQRGRRKVREFVYQWEKDGYTSPDMTILADHITESGIQETALQRLPDSILWCVLGDGSVAALTYERDQEVVGWHKHKTDGKFLSVCVIPDGDEDRIYFAVERNGRRMIEEMQPRTFSVLRDAFYVDGGVTASGADIIELDGLDHLEGCTVQVLADGAVQSSKTVTGGRIRLDTPAQTVTAGLAYESLLSPMPIEIEMQDGSSILRKKIIGELRVKTYTSVGGEVRCGGDVWQKIESRDVLEDDMDSAISSKTEVNVLAMQGGYEESATVEVRQTEPLPLNVTALVARYEV